MIHAAKIASTKHHYYKAIIRLKEPRRVANEYPELYSKFRHTNRKQELKGKLNHFDMLIDKSEFHNYWHTFAKGHQSWKEKHIVKQYLKHM
jgi:hypothetical protein